MLHAYGTLGGRFSALNRLLGTDRFVPAALLAQLGLVMLALCPTQAQAALSVAVVDVVAHDHYRVERTYGGELRARRASTLGFRHAGELVDVAVDEGDRVTAGTVLARLDDEPLKAQLEQAEAALGSAQASLAVERANLELARQTCDRFRNLLEAGHTSEQRFDEVRLDLQAREARIEMAEAAVARARADLRLAQVQLDRTRIIAPYDALVQRRDADEGAMLVPGQAVLRIVEAGALEARIGLPQDVAASLATGTRHRFRSGNERFEGELVALLPEIDSTTRTVTALFSLPADVAPAGATVELAVERDVPASGFWLPLTALSEAQRGLWAVYALTPGADGTVTERRLVEVLHTERDRVFVRGTLRAGEQVVATGTQRIVPGQVVEGIASR